MILIGERAGCSAATVGLSTSIYYLGVAVAAPLLPWLMRRSQRGVIVAGMVADGLTTALFPLAHGLFLWNLLRLKRLPSRQRRLFFRRLLLCRGGRWRGGQLDLADGHRRWRSAIGRAQLGDRHLLLVAVLIQ